jgi:hypothetical protein
MGAPATATVPTLLAADGSYELDGSSETALTITMGTLTTGQVLVGWAQSYGLGITPPTGWTTLASGTVTNLHYALAYKVIAGSDDLTWDFSAIGCARMTVWKFDDDGSSTLDASTPVEATATSVALDTTEGSGWVGSWNTVGVAPGDQSNGAAYDYPSTTTIWDLTTYSDGALNAGYGYVASSGTPGVLDVVTYTVAATDKAAPHAAQTCEWVTLCLGWTA